MEELENLSYLFFIHLFLAIWFFYGKSLFNLNIYIFLSIILSSIHQHFLSEWLHEATHWNLMRNKFLNDLIANLLLGIPFGKSVNINRISHFEHHKNEKFLNQNDLESQPHIIRKKKKLLKTIFASISGITAINYFLMSLKRANNKGKLNSKKNKKFIEDNWLKILTLFHAPNLLFLFIINRLDIYIIYYGTLITLYPLFATMRFWGQHAIVIEKGIAKAFDSNCSRSNYGGLIEFLFFNTPVMKYHFEHHKYPNLPFRRLRKIAKRSSDLNRNGNGCINISIKVWKGLL